MGSEHELKRKGKTIATMLALVIRCLNNYISIRRRILQVLNACGKKSGLN